MKPLLIGQAPSRVMQAGDPPFKGTQALARLAKYCGVTANPNALYDVFDFMNLVDQYPGPSAPGSKWDAKPRVDGPRLEFLHREIMRRDRVVLLGAVARDVIMGNPKAPMFVWRNASDAPLVLYTWSAHPGGTSMWWNQPKNREAGVTFWRVLYRSAFHERDFDIHLDAADG